MNTLANSDAQFTDNLTKAYRGYQTLKDFNCCAKTQTSYLKGRLTRFRERINELREVYFNQTKIADSGAGLSYKITSDNEALQIYFRTHSDAKARDFDGGAAGRDIVLHFDTLWAKAVSEQPEKAFITLNYIAYMDVPLMGDLRSEWDIRIHDVLITQIGEFTPEELETMLFYITLIHRYKIFVICEIFQQFIARGIFFLHKFIGGNQNHLNWVADPQIAYSVIFTEAFDATRGLVGAIFPERIPVAHPQNQGTLKEFTYRQFVLLHQLWDITSILRANKSYQYHISDSYREDPDRFTCFTYFNVNLRNDVPRNELQVHVQFKHLFNGDFASYQLKPMKIFKWMLKEPQANQFFFNPDRRRWIFDPARNNTTVHTGDVQQVVMQVKVQEKVLKQMDEEKTSQKLVQILDLMPTLQIKLSKHQQNVVASNQNMLCLGRSGTGKTTTSVLRLFAQEILYTVLKKMQNKQQPTHAQTLAIKEEEKVEKKEQLLCAKDLEKNTGMKMVFITASPVLTNEVRRFYGSIKKKLIYFLEERDKRIEEKRAKFQNITEQEAQAIIKEVMDEQAQEEASKSKETIQEQEKREILDFLKMEEKNLQDDVQIESEMDLPNSFDALKSSQFPLFITVKRLIYMMDACLSFSFFSRDHNNNIIGLDSNLGWHNEAKGVMMINHYFKENIDYDQQLQKFGKELMEIEKDMDIGGGEFEDDDYVGNNFKIIQEQTDGKTSAYNNRKTVTQGNKFLIEKQQLSFEVDYDIFESKFWPKIAHRRCLKKLSPTLVWTEIYSVIKGGMSSCAYYQGYLPKREYVHKEGSYFLSITEKTLIYFIYLEYERWKAGQNAYDFMDVVNHLQKRLYHGDTIKRMSIDYLMVDEVQDLTPKTLQTLLKLTSHKVFFAGDTAQTIAKGVGARFLDLREIFVKLDFTVPQIVQLTKNYRSHGRILDLANSVVSLIELLFPRTIDKLVKEESDMDGMKPLVIMPLDQFHLRTFFTGTAVTSSQQAGQQLAAPQFGCNQVLIVRDQMAKDYVPDIFKNMLCLTVYEAKGLEFDDVILYNFFHLGDVSKSQWKLLNDVVIKEVSKLKYEADLLDFDALDPDKFESFMQELKKQERREDAIYEKEKELFLNREIEEVYRKFTMLCIEMKFLYVAITRPKRRLIIYDDGIDGRRPIQNYWEKLGVVDVVTKDMVQNPELLQPRVREIFMSGQLVNERSSQDQWRIQGIKLFKKKYYDAAAQCFANSDDNDLVLRCKAYKEADIGTAKISEADSCTWKAQVTKQMSKLEKRKLLKDAKKERTIGKKHFENAGFLFEQIKMLRHAASCFYTARNYVKSAEIFEHLEFFGQAAECHMMTNELSKAAKLYEKANLVTKAIECYESDGDWEQVLHCLHRNKDFFKAEERQSLINKYVPVALNSLYKLYSSREDDDENELDESNKGKMQEMKIKMKYQKKTQVIAEEEDEDYSSEEEEEVAEEPETVEEEENPQQEGVEMIDAFGEKKEEQPAQEDVRSDKQDDGEDDSEIEVLEEEYDLLDEVFKLKKQKSDKEEAIKQEKSKRDDSSFDIIDTSVVKKEESKQEEQREDDNNAVEFKDDFEHLSQYDPEDEFLRSSRSVSIIDSILSKKSVSKTSDFSIIQSQHGGSKIESILSSHHQVAFVEQNRDIYAEDVITQKIIYYISLFSDDVSSHLSKIRSKKILFSNNSALVGDEQKQEDLFIFDLDDVDTNFVNLILDVLEYYELFRLCLMLCNRYHMSERLGRYLVSVCSKYSNLHMHRFNLKMLRTQSNLNDIYLQKQRMASIIAHEALHNVFSLIETKFLQIKGFSEALTPANSLGIDTYRTMLDLGFWKKLVYIGLDGRQALDLCYAFFNSTHFDLLTREFVKPEGEAAQVVKEKRERLGVREYWLSVGSAIRDVRDEKEVANAIKESSQDAIKDLVSADTGILAKTVTDFQKLLGWIHHADRKIEDFVKKGQKLSIEQEEKIVEKIQGLNDDESYEIYEIMKAQGLFDSKVETFNKYMLSYMLATIPSSGNYFKFLTKVRTYFDKEAVEQLINTYTWTVQQLNMEASHTSDIALDALYSVFQLSNLEGIDVFKHYRDADMIMMNVNSILFKDVVTLQQSIDGVQINNFMAKKMAELRPRYFQLKNFRSAFIKEYKDFINAFNQKKAFISDKHTASSYIIDMDSQFVMVPKNWVTKLIIIKLLSLCISLANELRNISHEDYKEEEEEAGATEESKHPQTFEKQLEKRLKEIQTIQRVNMLSLDTQKIQEKYAEAIERIDAKQMHQLCKNPEFDALVQSYRQKIMFNSIKFNSVTNSAAKYLHSPLNFIGAELYLNFDFGILYNKQKISEINEILNFAINSFKSSISLEGFENTSSQDDEDDLRTIQMKYRLLMLIKSFAAFILADEYEIMVELIKGELKIYKKREQTQSVKDVVWILSKFMLALDIHYYMRCGSIKSASKTILDFLNAFSKYLTYQEKIKLLSSTFFMVFVGKAGQGYIPDYGMRFLDFGYNFDQYYGGRGNMGADVLSHGDNCDFLNGETPPIEEEEREIVKREYEGHTIELVADEELYINILNQIIKQLDLINKDERSAFYKSQYIQIFNILMTVAVNDQKKSTKIIDILSKGFELICNSSYDEYFQHQGLTEFNYSNAQGFNELFKQFKECEDEYKHQFFANARFGGYQLVHIDVKKSQTKEAQAKIAQAIDKNFFREVKKVASHIYLGQLLKKKLRTRRQHYQAIRRAKSTYIFEERQMAELLGLKEMLVIEQLPSKAILELLQQIQKKEACLRQLIVCKFAVNSLDTHYILAKATELNQVYHELLDKSKSYIAEKGKILFEFLDVENEQDELSDSITKAKLRFIEIDNDVGTWMTQKAEPNLVEVERKNTKYKIKWESMKIYDKRLKIKALQAKGREITAK